MAEPQTGPARGYQASEVARALAGARGKFAVLYGKRSSGKTELIRDSLVPLLAQQGPVYYGECGPELPARVQGREGDIPIDWNTVPGGILILDDFDQILALPERSRREVAKKLLAAAAASGDRGTIALVACDDNLRSVFALRDLLPDITDNLFELPGFSLADSLASLAAAEPAGGLSYDPELLEALQKDLEQFRQTSVTQALSGAIHERLKASPGRPIGMTDYRAAGGLNGILAEYLKRQLEKLGEELGADAAEAACAVLEEVASGGAGTPPKLRDIPARLGVAEQAAAEATNWLEKRHELLRSLPGGRFEVRPAQLAEMLQKEVELRRRELEPAQRALEEALRAWRELGSLIPQERFEGLQGLRKQLRTTQDQAVFLTHCALRYATSEGDKAPRYWLARIPDRAEQAATLMRALFDPRGEVRARAAGLLADFDEPEVRHQLYRMALEDADAAVRRQALASLERQHIDDFRERLEEEANDAASPYRLNAVVALRLFRDQRAASFLQRLVNDPATELSVRGAAIDTLAAMAVPEAADALVSITLEDEDAEDRETAASALATIDSEQLQALALERIRQARRAHGPRQPFRAGTALAAVARLLLAALVVTGNILLHGLALLVLRRFKWAGLFFGLEALGVIGIGVYGPGSSHILTAAGWLLLFLNLFASQLAAFRAAQSGGPAARTSFRTLLGFLLLLPNLLTFLLFHGLAHLLVKQVRRGLMLFGLELLGLACASILFIYRDLFAVSELPAGGLGHVLAKHVPRVLELFYGLSAVALFAGSFLWDIAGAGYLVLRSRRRLENERRRTLAYGKLMGNRAAATVVLSALRGTDPDKARWARRLIRRVARGMPPSLLIEWLSRNAVAAPRAVLRALAHTKQEGSLLSLCGLWERAGAPLRGCILRVLAIEPTESSLQWFKKLLPQAGTLWRVRYYISAVDYRIRLWPKPLVVMGAWLLPSVLLLFCEGAATAQNETRPLIKSIRVTVTSMAKPGWTPHRPAPHQLSGEERRVIETARFLARRYPDESIDDLLGVFDYLQQAPGDSLRESRRGLTNSLVILAAQPGRTGRLAKRALTDVLRNSANPQRQLEMTEALLQASSSEPSRQAWRAGLVSQQEAARGVLSANATALKQALFSNLDTSLTLQIIGFLEAAGNPQSVDTLKEFIIRPGTPAGLSAVLDQAAGPDANRAGEVRAQVEGVRELQRKALASLGRIGTPAARDALTEIAARGSSDSLRRAAMDQQRQMLTDRIAEVRGAFGDGDFDKAIVLGEKVLAVGPSAADRADLLRVLGEASYRQSMATSQTDPSKAGTLEDKAIRYLEQARAAGNTKPETIRLQALSYAAKARRLLDAGNTRAALAQARQALLVDPQCDEAQAALGSVLLETGDRAGALRAFADATAISPGYTYAYYMQALILTDERKYAEAEQLTVKAIGTDPDAGWTYQLLRRIYLEQNRASELVTLLESTSAKYPSSIYPRQELGYVYHEYLAPADPSNYARACNIYRQLQKQVADRPAEKQQTDASIAECSLTTGRYQEALRLASDVMAKTSDYRVPMQLIAYAARVAAADYSGAAVQLDSLEQSVRGPEAKPEFSWVYDGTQSYLKRTRIAEPAKGALVRLVAAVNACGKIPAGKKPPELPASLFEDNRAALRTLSIRQQ